MARTQVATDNFNRASLGADWAQLAPINGSIDIYNSTNVKGTNALSIDNAMAARWVGAGTFSNDQYSSLVLSVVTWVTADYSIGVICRASADTNANRDFYGASVLMDSSGDKTTVLYKYVNGTYTAIYSAAVAWTVGDRIELEVEGTTLRVCKNGTPLGGSFTQTDSSIATGSPGVACAGGNTVYGDDWIGGSLTAATVAPIAVAYYQTLRNN